MGDYRFKHIPEDAVVLGIGALFKKNSNRYWGINLSFSKRLSRSSIPIAGAPLIRRFKTLSAKQSNEVKGQTLTFTIGNAQQWKRRRLKDYPALRSMRTVHEQEQWCFEIELSDGTVVFLPQFELARVLFLHDNYMSRICLEHDKLSSDFNIKNHNGSWQIDAMPTSSYPLDSYTDERCRRFLSWMLMDSDVRASFESIHQMMMNEHTRQGQYQMWDFSFIPPRLEGASLQVSGWNDWNTNSFFVWEIRQVDDLPVSMPDEVDFYHPKFERQVNARGGGTYKGRLERPEEHELDGDESANPDKKRVILDAESVRISFKKPIKSNRVTERVKSAPHGKLDESEPGEASDKLSPNDDDVTGTIPGADYDIVEDETDDAHLYENKFDCFFQMIDSLENKHGCQANRYPLRKLPKLARCKKHMLSDDANPRCVAVIELTYQAKTFHVVEVDTSDAKDTISTMILKLRDNGRLLEQIAELEIRLLKKSIAWPRDYLEELCGDGNFTGVSHPSCKHKGLIDPADIDKWADRFVAWLES